jgi:WD domain, G-beta repeat.
LNNSLDANGEPLPPDPKTGDLDDSAKGRCVDISPDDKYMAVGCKDGTLRVFFNLTTLNL